MNSKKSGFTTIDEYIAAFPEPVQEKLQELRATIKAAAPDATEKISYQMPTFALAGNVVYFAAWKTHIGFYPATGEVRDAFADELARYDSSKGAIKFSLDEPLPLDLIRKMVEFRVAQNLKKAEEKSRKKRT